LSLLLCSNSSSRGRRKIKTKIKTDISKLLTDDLSRQHDPATATRVTR
jgi:hypothetical protein